MKHIKVMAAVGVLCTLAASAAIADTAKSQAKAEQIHNLNLKAEHQQLHAQRAEAKGRGAYAATLEQKAQTESNQAHRMYRTRKLNQLNASRNAAFRAERDQQRANHFAKIGDKSKAAFLRRQAAIRTQKSDNIRSHYGKKDINNTNP